MKKILMILTLVFLLTGCTNINKAPVDTIIDEVKMSKLKLSNTNHKGYKYYMPGTLSLKEVDGFNEIITYQNYKYYLYVDIISYFNKISKEYKVNPEAYISKEIKYEDKEGYLEVNKINDKYLIEIMYNYAKMELIVDIGYLNEAITNSMIILSTIKYNDDIIQNMMGEDILNFNEEQLDIFEVSGRESKFLEHIQNYDTYEDDVHDPDLIN